MEIEDLGYLGEALERGGVNFRYVDAEALTGEGPQLTADPVIVLGGPMGAYELENHPYLAGEIELIRQRLDDRRPVLGFCLGAQLLAAAAGARVYPGAPGLEIGWAGVELTEAGLVDPLWAGFPRRFTTFHWHADTFDLPNGAELLARSDHYIQAFRLGAHAYGVQFHPEVVPRQLEHWIRAYRLELERERLAASDVLAVPAEREHRELAFRFGDNIARWLHSQRG